MDTRAYRLGNCLSVILTIVIVVSLLILDSLELIKLYDKEEIGQNRMVQRMPV